MIKKGQKIEGAVLVVYCSSNICYSGTNNIFEPCSKQFGLLQEKEVSQKKVANTMEFLVTLV
jgi:hypothetical protein